MKSLKGWTRFNKAKEIVNKQLASANTEDRLNSIAKRVQVIETAIRKMNHNNGVFLDKPAIATLYTLEQMKLYQAKLQNK